MLTILLLITNVATWRFLWASNLKATLLRDNMSYAALLLLSRPLDVLRLHSFVFRASVYFPMMRAYNFPMLMLS